MISICCEKLDELDMRLNLKKSQIVRIGRLGYVGLLVTFCHQKVLRLVYTICVFVFTRVLTRCMLYVVILVNLFSYILLGLLLIVNHICYTVAML